MPSHTVLQTFIFSKCLRLSKRHIFLNIFYYVNRCAYTRKDNEEKVLSDKVRTCVLRNQIFFLAIDDFSCLSFSIYLLQCFFMHHSHCYPHRHNHKHLKSQHIRNYCQQHYLVTLTCTRSHFESNTSFLFLPVFSACVYPGWIAIFPSLSKIYAYSVISAHSPIEMYIFHPRLDQ